VRALPGRPQVGLELLHARIARAELGVRLVDLLEQSRVRRLLLVEECARLLLLVHHHVLRASARRVRRGVALVDVFLDRFELVAGGHELLDPRVADGGARVLGARGGRFRVGLLRVGLRVLQRADPARFLRQ